ncbi:hypothetical protein NDU88_007470 [Pleurodeles waltl]|uniref:Uncharacterized protein n=1 Tax=Pleurodeles waltl TaxID=8319 RepID=A0AAV7NXG9_PLEWA|nr:hypothetical protein NDU88_007470 [Pleurodeles waltl]
MDSATKQIPAALAGHQRSSLATEQSGCGTKTVSWSCRTACTDRCLKRTEGDPRATAPVVGTPPRVLRKEEHAPTPDLAGSRGWSTGPRKGEEERRGGSSGSQASRPRNNHRKKQEIVGSIGPDSEEAQRGPRRWSTGPRRSKENRCDGSGGPRVNPHEIAITGRKEIADATGPGPAEARRDPRRWNTRPSRGEEDRHGGIGEPQRSPF